MVTSRTLYLCFLAFIGAERMVELWLSRRNAARAFARGGREYGRDHFPFVVVQQIAFLVSCAAESSIRRFPGALGYCALVVAIACCATKSASSAPFVRRPICYSICNSPPSAS